jgi:adenylate cyclase
MSTDSRRLAAIMFTDMVGYSALTHSNETLTLELLKEHREIVRGYIVQHGGREIDTAGDGFAIEFPNTLGAVQCAIEIQRSFARRNHSCEPERRVLLRVGIHLGDIVEFSDERGNSFSDERKNNLFGDAMNIAARLQPLAPVGGICISQAVYGQIKSRIEAELRPMGPQKLKGIAAPVEVYSIELEPKSSASRVRTSAKKHGARLTLAAGALATLAAAFLLGVGVLHRSKVDEGQAGDALRFAVMPFESSRLRPDEGFLPDGLTTGVISALSQQGLHVLAKSSMVEVQREHKSLREIGRELKIGQLVSGIVSRPAGTPENSVKISISLVDTETQEVLWTQELTENVDEVYAIQTKLAEQITRYLQSRSLVAGALEKNSRSVASIGPLTPKHVPLKEAYTAFLKGQYFLEKRTAEGYRKAVTEFEAAIALDPKFSDPFAALANAADLSFYYGLSSPVESALKMSRYAQQALVLEPTSAAALLALAEEKFYVEYDHIEAEALFLRAIAANPSQSIAHHWYGHFLIYRRRFAEAKTQFELSSELDPLNLSSGVGKGLLPYFSGDMTEAVANFKKVIELDNQFMLAHYWLGLTLSATKQFPEALASLRKAVELSERAPMQLSALACALASAGQRLEAEKLYAELLSLSETRYVSPYHLATVQTALGNRKEAIALLKKTIKEFHSQTAFIPVDPQLHALENEPEFKALVASLKPRSL